MMPGVLSWQRKRAAKPISLSLKRSLPFLTVDAAIDNQALSHDRCNQEPIRCNIFPGLSYNKANNTFLNSLRRKDVEAKVEFTLEMIDRKSVV